MDDCDKFFKEWVEKEEISSDSLKGHYMLKGAYLGFRGAWDCQYKESKMDEIFTYGGENVDSLSEEQLRKALKQCIHDLYQERRYKHSETDFVCEGVRKYGKVIDAPFPELPRVYSSQNLD